MAKTNSDIQSKSYLRHRKQRLWQILIPVWLGILLILAVAALVVWTASGSGPGGVISAGADTAIIWLILPVLFFAFVGGVILLVLIYLLAKVLGILPSYTYLGQQYAELIAAQVTYWANLAVKPIFAVRGFLAGARTLFDGLFGRSKPS
jgi:hypothetical protein